MRWHLFVIANGRWLSPQFHYTLHLRIRPLSPDGSAAKRICWEQHVTEARNHASRWPSSTGCAGLCRNRVFLSLVVDRSNIEGCESRQYFRQLRKRENGERWLEHGACYWHDAVKLKDRSFTVNAETMPKYTRRFPETLRISTRKAKFRWNLKLLCS